MRAINYCRRTECALWPCVLCGRVVLHEHKDRKPTLMVEEGCIVPKYHVPTLHVVRGERVASSWFDRPNLVLESVDTPATAVIKVELELIAPPTC